MIIKLLFKGPLIQTYSLNCPLGRFRGFIWNNNRTKPFGIMRLRVYFFKVFNDDPHLKYSDKFNLSEDVEERF